MPNAAAAAPRSPVFLRLALGFIYFHFGVLKFFPDLSPAEMISTQTVMSVSLNLMDAHTARIFLAYLECAIGVGLLFNLFPRVTFALFLFHMAGTFSPLVVLPEYTFKIAPFAPTVEGQYIFKNLVFVAAGWTVLMPHVFSRSKPVKQGDRPRAATSNIGEKEAGTEPVPVFQQASRNQADEREAMTQPAVSAAKDT